MLCGSRELHVLDQYLTTNTSSDLDLSSTGFIKHLVDICVEAHDFEVVILDLNPSVSKLNEFSIDASDYIMCPVNSSTHSFSSVHGLIEFIIPMWKLRHENIVHKQNAETDEGCRKFNISSKYPQFLPFPVTNFDILKQGDRSMVSIFDTQALATLQEYLSLQLKDGKVKILLQQGVQPVIPFLRRMKVVSHLEELGRAFVEVNENDFLQYWSKKTRYPFPVTREDGTFQCKCQMVLGSEEEASTHHLREHTKSKLGKKVLLALSQ